MSRKAMKSAARPSRCRRREASGRPGQGAQATRPNFLHAAMHVAKKGGYSTLLGTPQKRLFQKSRFLDPLRGSQGSPQIAENHPKSQKNGLETYFFFVRLPGGIFSSFGTIWGQKLPQK